MQRKGARWGVTDYLLADVYAALVGKPHAARPKSKKQQEQTAERARAQRAVRRQFAARNRAIASGQQRRSLPAAPTHKGV